MNSTVPHFACCHERIYEVYILRSITSCLPGVQDNFFYIVACTPAVIFLGRECVWSFVVLDEDLFSYFIPILSPQSSSAPSQRTISYRAKR